MAETPSSSLPPPPPPNNPDPTQYWCYQCNKRVPIETLPGQADVICFECKNGFVELISPVNNNPQPPPELTNDDDDEQQPAFGNDFLQVLRLLALAAREDHAPHLPPPNNDYLRIELEGWNENDNDYDDDENENENEAENEPEDDDENPNRVDRVREGSEDEDEDVHRRRQRRDVIRDLASRALSRRGHRILDWAEILTELEDDSYIGNPGDYVDAAGYEALLQRLGEIDTGGKRPAAKRVVEELPCVVNKMKLLSDGEVCVICKDNLFNNEEEEVVKQLPCGHMYHEDCIVPWLGSRNTCPVCRYELVTDDPEYEEDRRRKRSSVGGSTSAAVGASDDHAVV